MTPLTVSIDEFCRLVGIGRTKAFECIRDREVVAAKIGRKTVVTFASIEALIERNIVRRPY